MGKTKGLGRGLDALMGDTATLQSQEAGSVLLPISQVEPGLNQPRKRFDEEALSIPSFIIAIVFIWVFAIKLGWFPVSGMKTPGSNYTGLQELQDRLYYMALPLIAMTFASLGGMTRYTRAAMSEALSLDCIRTARAKGLRERVVVYSHAFRNALIPIITLVIGWFTGIFSGSIVIENIFGLNGVGRIYIESLSKKDFEVVLLLQMFYVILGLVGNLVVDLAYGLADPRVRVNK